MASVGDTSVTPTAELLGAFQPLQALRASSPKGEPFSIGQLGFSQRWDVASGFQQPTAATHRPSERGQAKGLPNASGNGSQAAVSHPTRTIPPHLSPKPLIARVNVWAAAGSLNA